MQTFPNSSPVAVFAELWWLPVFIIAPIGKETYNNSIARFCKYVKGEMGEKWGKSEKN
jgi:predicted secreted protein